MLDSKVDALSGTPVIPSGVKLENFSYPLSQLAGDMRLHQAVSVIRLSMWFRMQKRVWSLFLAGMLAAGISLSTFASVSANLIWTASSDPSVAGYNIYYGSASHQYTNMVSVGQVTNAVIAGLVENTTYYFAAKACNSGGTESDFSNEAAFVGVTASPNGPLGLKTLPENLNGDPLAFSLGAGSPAGATINPTNGIIYWTPGRAYASTTNYLTVNVTDTVNPALSTAETMVVFISDYLDFQLGATAVSAGQSNNLPLVVAASSTLTNVQLTLDWPGSLLNPTLTFVPPIIAGSLQYQNNQLLIQLQTSADQPLTGTNLVAQINFQTAAGQPSSVILSIPATSASGNTANGNAYANVLAEPGEVVVVGTQPILRPQSDPILGRSLSLFANPGTYELQYATSLATPVNWTTLMTYQQTNVAQTVSLDSVNPVVFYRLQQD